MTCLLIKTIGRKEKNVFKIFANTKIIDFNHTCLKKCSIGVTQYRNNVDIKIKLIRYDLNGVPNFFPLNSATCIFPVLYDIYVLDLH
jgi:hypothetical protein